jgi:hypothetical protein
VSTIKLQRLDSGYIRAQGNGPCNWAQWMEGSWPKESDFFPEACEEFRRDLVRQLERERAVAPAKGKA